MCRGLQTCNACSECLARFPTCARNSQGLEANFRLATIRTESRELKNASDFQISIPLNSLIPFNFIHCAIWVSSAYHRFSISTDPPNAALLRSFNI